MGKGPVGNRGWGYGDGREIGGGKKELIQCTVYMP